MTGGRGGRRPGAGRPKGSRNGRPARAAKVAEGMGDDVQEALALLREFMRNKKLAERLRKDCAIELLDRAIGRPAQHKIVDATVSVVKEYVGWSPENWDDDEEENDKESGALQAMEMADSTPE